MTTSKYFLIILASLLSCGAASAREKSYARLNSTVKLQLDWATDNYGDIQWQQSTDDGATWTNINGATSTEYSFNISDNTLIRAQVTGDPACPQIMLEREVVPVSFTTALVQEGSYAVTLEVSNLDLADAQVIEYGFCANYADMGRNYALMPRVKTGESLPAEPITIECTGLLPNSRYSVRPYFVTSDGSVIFGGGKIANTLEGMQWSTEDWTIEKTEIQARFSIEGASGSNVKFLFGPDRDHLTSYEVQDLGNNQYASPTISGLQPGAEYIAVAQATIDGEPHEIIKTVKTWSDYSDVQADETVTPVSHVIEWDESKTLTSFSPEGMQVEYPRMIRVDDNTLLLTYHGGASDHWKNSYLRRSTDNGRTWSEPATIFDASKSFLGSGYYRICNPEMLKLQNGWILLSVVANANPETNSNCKVLTCISRDGGLTWSDPVVVGRGRTWEPQMIQMPNGEIELLVSSEAAWFETQPSNMYQEILSARSTDNGQTWTQYKRAAYLPNCRDGMPVSVVMQGNKGVMFVIESVGGNCPASLVYRSLDGEWSTEDWDRVEDQDRWFTNHNNGCGAPYMIQLTTGEFLIMAHTGQTGSVWQTCRPQIVMADNTGHNFKYKRLPLSGSDPLPAGTGAYYNSFFQFDDDTVWLLITKAEYDGSTRKNSAIMRLEGKIVEK
ncbi:MAG: glycoside hydrolase [Bacteroidales bacterium]|nr:glycoside hydrolase [Bacteroidales bacterium]